MVPNSELYTPCPTSVEAPPAPTSLRDAPIVVVGGGPIGLLAAAMLTHRGARQVTVIERAADPTAVNPSRSYVLAVTARGRRTITKCPRLLPYLEALGVVTDSMHVATLNPGDKLTEYKLPADKKRPFIFLRRADFVAAMCEYLKAECPSITLRTGTSLEDVSFDTAGTTTLSVKDADGVSDSLKATLVLACDGAGSAVLKKLCEHSDSPLLQSKAGFGDTAFDVFSSKLRVKSVVMRPESRAVVAAAIAEKPDLQPLEKASGFAFNGCGATDFRLSSVCMSDHACKASGGYLGMIATEPGTKVLTVRDVDVAFELFQKNFPQVRVRELITEDAMRDFVNAGDGWRFGSVRRANSLAGVVGARGDGGIVVLGDAAQAAPPDIGQGLNSGLEDVGALMAIIDAAGPDATAGSLATEYEQLRDPDIDGLMYFNKCSAKWQLNRKMCPEIVFWKLGIFGRVLLNKLLPNVFHPPMLGMFRDPVCYGEMRRRAAETTSRIWMTVGAAAGAVCAVLYAKRGGFF